MENMTMMLGFPGDTDSKESAYSAEDLVMKIP